MENILFGGEVCVRVQCVYSWIVVVCLCMCVSRDAGWVNFDMKGNATLHSYTLFPSCESLSVGVWCAQGCALITCTESETSGHCLSMICCLSPLVTFWLICNLLPAMCRSSSTTSTCTQCCRVENVHTHIEKSALLCFGVVQLMTCLEWSS
jgi:hypothetical protein